MSIAFVLLPLFLVPAGALLWRLIVTKTRAVWIRVGAAAAAMMTLLGAFMLVGPIADFNFRDWRSVFALVCAASGSVYLLLWSQRKHGNRRHRTVSIMAALIGLVPVIGAVLSGLLFSGAI